jgi:hypothetical protein
MDRYLVANIVMDDGEKRWPVFLFQHNASCKRTWITMLVLLSLTKGSPREWRQKIAKRRHMMTLWNSTSCCGVFSPFYFLHMQQRLGLTEKSTKWRPYTRYAIVSTKIFAPWSLCWIQLPSHACSTRPPWPEAPSPLSSCPAWVDRTTKQEWFTCY